MDEDKFGIGMDGDEEYYGTAKFNDLNFKVQRIVFKDILVDPENLPEGGIDRSLSIPLYDKIRPVWAPNGYGKTFVFNLLSHFNTLESNEEGDLGILLTEFLESCLEELSSPQSRNSDLFSGLDVDFKNLNVIEKGLIPFSKMMIRMIEPEHDIVVDLSIKPIWVMKNGMLEEPIIKRKFWNTSSLENSFFSQYSDLELDDILRKKSSLAKNSVIQPIFLESSFIFPEGEVKVMNLEEEVSDWADINTEIFPIDGRAIFSQEIIRVLKSFKQQKIPDGIGQNVTDTLPLFSRLIDFCLLNMNRWELGEDLDEIKDRIKNGEELLLELFDLSKKWNDTPLILRNVENFLERSGVDTYFVDHGSKRIIFEADDENNTVFDYLFVLLDTYLHDFNPPLSDFSKNHALQVEKIINQGFDIYDNPEYGLSELCSMPFRVFGKNPSFHEFLALDSNVEYFSGVEDEISEKGMPIIWNDLNFADAICNLRFNYFEIPKIINYSSKKKLLDSQRTMNDLLKAIASQKNMTDLASESFISTHPEANPQPKFILDDLSPEMRQPFIGLLSYIKDTLGNREDTLDSFLVPLFGSFPWDDILEYLLPEENEEEVPWSGPITNLFYYPSTIDSILRFVEIYENINDSLNNEDSESWAASCRFNSWEKPMKFMDPKIGYEIESRHLSFGQCSVVALEVCIGAGLSVSDFVSNNRTEIFNDDFEPIDNVGLNSIQSCIILDEPEIGRSEHWVNKISERILETLDELASPVFGNIHETSLTIVSHRESLLRSLSRTNNYFVMQPLMNRDNLIIDFGEEE